MIQVKNVSKYFDDFKVLDDFSLNVKKGTIYGLVGPNGAGKTTIINHINGVLKPDAGEIYIDGERVYENNKIKESVLSIADDWFYYSTYTIKQMAHFYRDIYPSFNMERYEAIKGIFKIDEKRQIRKLSKGMKKQVAFWLTLSAMPSVLILDEPLDGLDPVMRKQVLNLVIADVTDREMTVLVSSHNLRELEDICDWVGIIHKGKMIIEKPLDDLKGSVHKYQMVIDENCAKKLEENSDVLHISKTGSVYNVIMRGDAQETHSNMKELSPMLCERISLTLEEVFIYELGGLGYDFKSIIV
ncbi:MAG: ABC transporter ATP-binding protein [Clostridia bacterium]|nr:ABC transporter ATP-binding protein [Clostridia bacterium]MBR2883544.1 ABC transporter ATP-binding protein [Clostridia bacterium]